MNNYLLEKIQTNWKIPDEAYESATIAAVSAIFHLANGKLGHQLRAKHPKQRQPAKSAELCEARLRSEK